MFPKFNVALCNAESEGKLWHIGDASTKKVNIIYIIIYIYIYTYIFLSFIYIHFSIHMYIYMYNMCISYVCLICKHIKVLDLQISNRSDLEATAKRSFRRNAAVVTSSARPGRVCTSPGPDTSWGLERCDRVKPLMYVMYVMAKCNIWRVCETDEVRRFSTFCTAHPGWREGRPALSQAPHRTVRRQVGRSRRSKVPAPPPPPPPPPREDDPTFVLSLSSYHFQTRILEKPFKYNFKVHIYQHCYHF